MARRAYKNYRPRSQNVRGFNAERRAQFLDALEKSLCVSDACKAVSISMSCAYTHRSKNGDFARAWDTKLKAAVHAIEVATIERALNGWEEPVFYQGQPCGRIRRFDTQLQTFLLKQWMPERYQTAQEQGAPQEQAQEILEFVRLAQGTIAGSPELVGAGVGLLQAPDGAGESTGAGEGDGGDA